MLASPLLILISDPLHPFFTPFPSFFPSSFLSPLPISFFPPSFLFLPSGDLNKKELNYCANHCTVKYAVFGELKTRELYQVII